MLLRPARDHSTPPPAPAGILCICFWLGAERSRLWKGRGECYLQALYPLLWLSQVPALAYQAVSPPSHNSCWYCFSSTALILSLFVRTMAHSEYHPFPEGSKIPLGVTGPVRWAALPVCTFAVGKFHPFFWPLLYNAKPIALSGLPNDYFNVLLCTHSATSRSRGLLVKAVGTMCLIRHCHNGVNLPEGKSLSKARWPGPLSQWCTPCLSRKIQVL